MRFLLQLIAHHEALLLFVVILVGLFLAQLRMGGVKLGLAGVLFAGLGFGFLYARQGLSVQVAPQIKELGLILFVYAVGLTSGSGFFSAFRTRGVRLNLALLGILVASAGLLVFVGKMLDIRTSLLAGVFAGALTNTPALGAASDVLRGSPHALDPALGYSVTYPVGVLGILTVFRLFVARSKGALKKEIELSAPQAHAKIRSASCVVEHETMIHAPIGELEIQTKLGVLISRVRRGDDTFVPNKYTVLQLADVITLVGTEERLGPAIAQFGQTSTVHPEVDRDKVDMRRILVSKRQLGGKTVDELELGRRFGAQVTRVRRADLDIFPSSNFRIEVGDRLRVVAPKERLAEVAQFFGDSERELAEVDYVALAAGIALGLVLGSVEVNILGTNVSLGAAGGPLLVALILGHIGRWGPFTFTQSLETNVALRELGILLFLAGVGVSAGGQLSQVFSKEGLVLFGLGAALTILSSTALILAVRRILRGSVTTALGASSGQQTQPAALAAAYEYSGKSEETYVAYAIVYPIAMISKIILAQFIASLP